MLKRRIRLITFIMSAALFIQSAIPYGMNVTYAEESTESGEDNKDASEDIGEDEPTDEIEPSESNPTEAEPTEAVPTETEPTETMPTEMEPTEEEPTVVDPVIGGGLNVVDGEGVIFDLDDGPIVITRSDIDRYTKRKDQRLQKNAAGELKAVSILLQDLYRSVNKKERCKSKFSDTELCLFEKLVGHEVCS